MQKTVHLQKEIHKALKLYATKNSQNIEDTANRILKDFLIRTRDLPSKEVK